MNTLRSMKEEKDRVCLSPTCHSPAHQSCHNHPSIRPQARWIISNALHPFYFSTYHLLFKSPPSLQLPFNLSSHLLHLKLSIIATHSELKAIQRTNHATPKNFFGCNLQKCKCTNSAKFGQRQRHGHFQRS